VGVKARKAVLRDGGSLEEFEFAPKPVKHRKAPPKKAESAKINKPKKEEAPEPRDAIERSLALKSSEYARTMVRRGK